MKRLLVCLLLSHTLMREAVATDASPDWSRLNWAPLDSLVQAQIDARAMPGAVLMMGQAQGVDATRVYGWRAREPAMLPMQADTVFDLASLTKVLATTTAVLQLVEQGKLALDTPVYRYWPAFGQNGKTGITVRHLLAHRSGLRAGLDMQPAWQGADTALHLIEHERLVAPPDSRTLYSDTNFDVLGELVERVSGEALAHYCQTHIFGPLKMVDTTFLPDASLRARAAPTIRLADGEWLQGQVQDPTARRMGGVAGHAGLFGTAADLARFARMLLNQGELDGTRILSPDSVALLTQRQGPVKEPTWRSLGWDMAAPLVPGRLALLPQGLIGHTGYTGTGLWIDMVTGRFVVILSNRLHPDEHGDARPLRREVLALLAHTQAPLPASQALPRTADTPMEPRPGILSGLDVLEEQGFAPLQGLRIGLVTNRAGLDRQGQRDIDVLRWAPGVRLATIFSPEHGLYADAEGAVASTTEPLSGIPIVSLYGQQQGPSPVQLQGLDAVVFDLQDAGVRFYTYLSTLGKVMEAASAAHLPVWVLDRPNPIGAKVVAGPMLDAQRTSFTAYLPMPTQHGMTLGELAGMIKADKGLDVDLHVVPMRGYRREMRYVQTGLDWIPPSPNLRTPATALLYAGVAFVEGSNVSVGRGTDHPFEWLGAPWIDAQALSTALQARQVPGVRFSPITFTPTQGPGVKQPCQGVAIELSDPAALRPALLGVELAAALHRLYPAQFQLDRTLGLIGNQATLQALRAGTDPRQIEISWGDDLQAFLARRQRFLLY